MPDNIQTDETNATILAAEEASVAVNNENYAQMILNGWTQIPVNPDPQAFARDNYVGAAFYKIINGVTEVIIANQGSENLYDFAVSDTTLALNGTPACDPDALTYYNAVVAWANNPANTGNTGGAVNVIETAE